MNKQGKTILLVEQNARAGLRLSTHGVVLENGRVRLAGSGHEVLHHPEIGALYLGGAVTPPPGSGTAAQAGGSGAAAAPDAGTPAGPAPALPDAGIAGAESAANGTAPR
jgi:hypothetical protein